MTEREYRTLCFGFMHRSYMRVRSATLIEFVRCPTCGGPAHAEPLEAPT